MVGVAGALVLVVLVAGHTLVAAVVVRLFRYQLTSRWAPIVYALAIVPIVLVASTLLVAGGIGIGPDLGSPGTAMFVLVAVPMGLGFAIDYLWMPAPEDVDGPVARES